MTIIQSILAAIFFLSGSVIYLLKDKLKYKLSWLTSYSPRMVLFICLSKIIGALGLFISMLFNLPFLTLISALGLASIMVLATLYHLKKKEYKDLPATLIFLVLLLFVVYSQF